MLSLWSILPQDDMETKNIHGQEKKIPQNNNNNNKKHPKNHSKADKKKYINIGPKVHTLLLPKDGKETPGKTSLWDMGGQSPCEQCYLLQTVMTTLSTSPCALGSLRARQQTERSNSAFQLPHHQHFIAVTTAMATWCNSGLCRTPALLRAGSIRSPYTETLCLQHRWVTSWGSLGSLLLTHWGTDILRTQCPKVRVKCSC